MLNRSEIFRAAAIVVLIAVCVATLAAINRRPPASFVETSPAAATLSPDDLSAELRRCDALGPQDAEAPHCTAVWEENRRRFFGKPARPLPALAAPAVAATTSAPGGAR